MTLRKFDIENGPLQCEFVFGGYHTLKFAWSDWNHFCKGYTQINVFFVQIEQNVFFGEI